MLIAPPEVVATWPSPNYDHPDSRGPELIIIEAITLSLALMCLGLRLYVKMGMLGRPRLDDLLMVLTVIAGVGLTVIVILANTRYGWNHHIYDLHTAQLMTARKVSFAAQILYLFTTSLCKISILLSYLNLAPPQTYFRSLSQVAIAVIAAGNISFFVVLSTQCIPITSYWDIMRINQDCHLRESHFLMAQAIFNVLADLAVWLLPLWTFYHARLPLSQRVALIVLFSFGAVVVVAACLRTSALWWAVGISWDTTWDCRQEWVWAAVETHLGIICGCVPWLKSLVSLWNRRSERASTQKIGSGRDIVSGRPSIGGGPRPLPAYSVTVNDSRWDKDIELLDRDSDGFDGEVFDGEVRRSHGGL